VGFVTDIFGGSKQKQSSESGNNAYPFIMQNYGTSGAGAFNGGLSALEGLLGIGGDPAASKAAVDQFWKSTGGDFLLNQGVDAINSNMYARGLGKSGAAMKGLEEFRQGLASTKLNDLIQNYLGISKLGLGAGSLVADAGQYSKGTSSGGSSTGGLGQFIGQMLPLALSFI
jgi:hypothetical protein